MLKVFSKSATTTSLVASMSRVGDCFDNAPMESFWGTLKSELMAGRPAFATRSEARAAIFEYTKVFYNRQRIHSGLGDQSPEQFDARLRHESAPS